MWSAFSLCLAISTPAFAGELVLKVPDETLIAEVADAEAIFMHGNPSVLFSLAQDAALAMADLTGAMVGETLTLSLCGEVLVSATVRERIAGRGIINLPSIEAAIATADVLNGDADCTALESHFAD